MEKRLVKIGDAAAMLGVAAGTLRKWESTGELLPARKAARDITTPINLKNKAVSSTVTACGEDGSGRGGNTTAKPASVKQEDLSTSC